MSSKKEKIRNTLNSVIKNQEEIHDDQDGLITYELNKTFKSECYHLGQGAQYIYDVRNGYFTSFEDYVYVLTGRQPNEIVFGDSTEFVIELVRDDHLIVLTELTQKAFDLCKVFKEKYESFVLNLEFNTKSKNGTEKRILNQFKPIYFEETGYPRINNGRIVDISHIKKDGVPILYVIADNKLIYFEEGNKQTMVNSDDIIFSKKEIEIMKLVSEGYAIKEIASKLNSSIATIYTHRKNIRQKSNEDINKTIIKLKEKGII